MGPAATLLLCALFGAQTFELGDVPLRASADHVRLDLGSRRLFLVGGAVAEAEPRRFAADQVIVDLIDPNRPAVLADGAVDLLGPNGERLRADRANYDWSARGGEFENLRLTLPLGARPSLAALASPAELPEALHVFAGHASQVGDLFRLDHGWITTSTDSPPQYRLLADRLDVTMGPGGSLGDFGRVAAHNGRLQLYGATVLGIPYLDIGPEGILLPQLGSNRTDGLYAQHEFAFRLMRDMRLTLTPRFGTETVVSGRLRLAYGGPWGTAALVLSLSERHLLEVLKTDVQASRVPELSYTAPPWEVPGLGGELTARLSWARLSEENRASAARFHAEAGYDRSLHRGDTSTLGVRLGGRWSDYAPGDWYGVLWGSLQVEKQFPYWFYNRVELTSHLIAGATPFRFDQIEIPTALIHEARLRLHRNWIFSNQVKLDLNKRVFRRWEFGLSFRDRDLEYGVRMLARPGFELFADARLVGF